MTNEKMLDECRSHWEKTKPDAVFSDYWLGWQASRESLVIELPKPWQTNVGAMLTPNGVRFAIEAAGLECK